MARQNNSREPTTPGGQRKTNAHSTSRLPPAGLQKTHRFEDGIIIRFLFQRTAPTDLASVERMIGHYSIANVEAPPPPALCRWSE